MTSLRTIRIRRWITRLVHLNHLFKGNPDVSRTPNKVFGTFQEGPGINHILRKEIDEFKEFVIGNFIINEFLDLVEKGDFFGGGKGLRGSSTRGKRDKIVVCFG
jgi:hypothetical protein